ncbi:hypothetical protein Q5P01_014545 [Channa striata]|uniref:SRR1-like domain-containing protein n=1 Tax=Channa striata TaxID=64152 RepID=A0AA88MIN4_CHASR|nr:hypothetical protein Q5P01_014545 [Channa striata]
MSDPGEEWQVARRRKGAGRKSKSLQLSSTSKCCEEQVDIRKTVARIRDTVSELLCEEFWLEWKEQLLVARSTSLSAPPDNKDKEDLTVHKENGRICEDLQCVCYGLGPFSSCVSARYQLAMLLLLLDAGQIPLKTATFMTLHSPLERGMF